MSKLAELGLSHVFVSMGPVLKFNHANVFDHDDFPFPLSQSPSSTTVFQNKMLQSLPEQEKSILLKSVDQSQTSDQNIHMSS